jgi:alkylation response protein AidB-like acyl-CoA dehydrogenase
MSAPLLESALGLAHDLLAPAAVAVDRSALIPPSHLDALADAGLYGLFAPTDHGGLIEADPVAAYRVVEILARACLSTAFVWVQHHGAVRSVAASSDEAVRQRWLPELSRGRARAGLALGGLRPGPPSVRVRPAPGGYRLDGQAPWVTGWGMVDLLLVAARDADDDAVWFLVDAPGLEATVVPMMAVMASRTVTVSLDGTFVPADRCVTRMPFARWPDRDMAGLRLNGSLALGLAARCVTALGGRDAGPRAQVLHAQLQACRDDLDRAGPADLPAARAAASALAFRAAGAQMTEIGARAVVVGERAELAVREAAFLLVFGSRPTIRDNLLRYLAATQG